MARGKRSNSAQAAASSKKNKKPLLVFVNPKSGTGHAKQLFKTELVPLLEKHDVPYELFLTEFAGHARDKAQHCDLAQYSGFVSISGDGLVHELYNGLYARGDWDDVSDFPFGLVPGGSGCALNCSVLRQQGQPLDGLNNLGPSSSVRNVALGAKNGTRIPLDVIEVELANGEKHISFLGVTMGVIADGDIGTEWLRCLGFMRTYLYVAWRTLIPIPYKARVSYLPLKRNKKGKIIPVSKTSSLVSLPPLDKPVPKDWVSEVDSYNVVYALNLSMLDPMTLFAEESDPGDGVIWMVFVRYAISRMDLIRWFMSLSDGPDFSNPNLDIVPVRAFRIEPINPTEGILSLDAESAHFGALQGQVIPQKASVMVSNENL